VTEAIPTLVTFDALTKVYGAGPAAVPALRGIDLSIECGEFVAIMGTSGCGKSTAMHIMGCLDVPTGGTYRFAGVDVGALTPDQRARLRRHYIGFVFQGFNLLGQTTALENVELPLVYRGVPVPERHRLGAEALASVGLTGRNSHTPAELSGGQQQRVAIARAIVTSPVLLLADEPTGNLDSESSKEIMNLLRQLNRDRGITIALVSHDPAIAACADRTIRFKDGRLDDSPVQTESA
jgi:putative ABC transport system ATP-binding protein